jgi:hypothetical protein
MASHMLLSILSFIGVFDLKPIVAKAKYKLN